MGGSRWPGGGPDAHQPVCGPTLKEMDGVTGDRVCGGPRRLIHRSVAAPARRGRGGGPASDKGAAG